MKLNGYIEGYFGKLLSWNEREEILQQIVDQKLFDVYRNFFKVRVFDCFIFHNELDILKLRIDYLKDTVDFFVIG